MRGSGVDGNFMNIHVHLPLASPVHQHVQLVLFDSSPLSPSQPWNSAVKMKYLVLQWRVWGSGGEGAQRAAYHARTSTSGWKKAVGVFVRRAAQTDRVKERLFESAVQEQQKTLPLDRVVKNECRGGIWHVAWREGGANMPKSAHDELPLLPATDRGWKGEDKEGGKQVERGMSLRNRASFRWKRVSQHRGEVRGTKADHEQGHNGTVWRKRKWYRISSFSLQPEACPVTDGAAGEVDTAEV